ncbi:MAG: class I SAM-dependent methyltransferase [Candidatus Komeilibacteria bacterium]|nr:class I SAM-dependent methyltransferase [Candidatus Komeilibacteria bacterium]
MQTPAEIYLIKKVAQILRERADLARLKILNVGAGDSAIIEDGILNLLGDRFISDRVDVVNCSIKHPNVGRCFIASAESMSEIKSDEYDLAFANYVLEHVADLGMAAKEIHRILKTSGYFITSLPNTAAPEFILSRYTSTKFHQLIRGKGEGSHAHATHYAYKSVGEFVAIFENFFTTIDIRYWPNTFGYLYKFPVVRIFSRVYDRVVRYLNIKMLMGNVCIVFRK